ncbi:MAG TPA: hypothetical protein VF767_03220 [Bryobacteraceae bacterium]
MTTAERRAFEQVLRRLPPLDGQPIGVQLLRAPRVVRGGLREGGTRGLAVHAGSFVRRRVIVLDAALPEKPGELARILVHELFHFAWLRAGNELRRSWEELLIAEKRRHARGELGWSAESLKNAMEPLDARNRTRRWREYACESFCDSAAWMFAGLRRHEEFTLAPRFRLLRRAWFARAFGRAGISI